MRDTHFLVSLLFSFQRPSTSEEAKLRELRFPLSAACLEDNRPALLFCGTRVLAPSLFAVKLLTAERFVLAAGAGITCAAAAGVRDASPRRERVSTSTPAPCQARGFHPCPTRTCAIGPHRALARTRQEEAGQSRPSIPARARAPLLLARRSSHRVGALIKREPAC